MCGPYLFVARPTNNSGKIFYISPVESQTSGGNKQ